MKTYNVTFQVSIEHTIQVQAENEDAAWDEAQEQFDIRTIKNFDYYTDTIDNIEEFHEEVEA